MEIYKPKNPIRIVTAASLFDGHDAAINIMRRIIQSTGCEVIHLGHNRSAQEIVDCAIQEDVQAIAITSYQGGHLEFFKYIRDLLAQREASHIRIFGGGGGTILEEEARELQEYGITKIYSPDDGRRMGLQGMINDLVEQSDFSVEEAPIARDAPNEGFAYGRLARALTLIENGHESELPAAEAGKEIPVVGITGTGGAGKSSLVDELLRRFLADSPEVKIGVLCVDPTRRKSGGALLGDRIRMNAIHHPQVYLRSMATRQAHQSVSSSLEACVKQMKAADFDFIILETAGIGQSDSAVAELADLSVYVMTPEFGAASQLEKIDMLDFADFVAINKFDKKGAEDALRDVRKQFARNKGLWHDAPESMPVFGTMASQFNDQGLEDLYQSLAKRLKLAGLESLVLSNKKIDSSKESFGIIPPSRVRYLAEIAESHRQHLDWVEDQVQAAQQLYAAEKVKEGMKSHNMAGEEILQPLLKLAQEQLSEENLKWIRQWPNLSAQYREEEFSFWVREKEIKIKTRHKSLSGTQIPKVSLPRFEAYGDLLRWKLRENLPGEYPFTAGVFPFKRQGEDPTRMFAGEGGPERTNRRFHYISREVPAKRLSTAFDSVTIYGEDPDWRPDIYGKIGNSGVNICCLDDMKKLYSGFDLADPLTSVSMTINGPAAIMTAYFMLSAIDQQCEKYILSHGMKEAVEEKIKSLFADKGEELPRYNGKLPEGHSGLGLLLLGLTGDQVLPKDIYENIAKETLNQVRGTVQADILKEDQAQNTCIFSTEFSLKLMGDLQQYFILHGVKNFYSVSISGYHIAEAGANPITQLAFTLANGFTYVEYYLARGMKIDDFAGNLSFFFSNGLDPEYAVIGRVARRIWASAMKEKYGANRRSQMLKYHIQTSGRSLHAQEIDFNDIRTTLQALNAVYDNCNSLHTNAFDEAITTPTEASVRRAMAIQMIINKELGLAKNENPLQGAFIIEELTDLVEEAVYHEFERISDRGGVTGAMETMYQRGKIQEESMYYEGQKHSGEYPIIGVNTFLSDTGSPTVVPGEVIRAEQSEKELQIHQVNSLSKQNAGNSKDLLNELKEASVRNENVFSLLMKAAARCSLGQITHALYEVGGRYRRNM